MSDCLLIFNSDYLYFMPYCQFFTILTFTKGQLLLYLILLSYSSYLFRFAKLTGKFTSILPSKIKVMIMFAVHKTVQKQQGIWFNITITIIIGVNIERQY